MIEKLYHGSECINKLVNLKYLVIFTQEHISIMKEFLPYQ